MTKSDSVETQTSTSFIIDPFPNAKTSSAGHPVLALQNYYNHAQFKIVESVNSSQTSPTAARSVQTNTHTQDLRVNKTGTYLSCLNPLQIKALLFLSLNVEGQVSLSVQAIFTMPWICSCISVICSIRSFD